MNDAQASSTGQITIYALTDPDTGEVRYIGQTIKAPSRRYYEHVSSNVSRTALGVWIRHLRHDGKVPGLTILEAQVMPWWSSQRECYWIRRYGDHGARLLNRVHLD